MAQSSHQGNSSMSITPGRHPRADGNSPPSGSSRPDSLIHAYGENRELPALRDRNDDVVFGDDEVTHVWLFPRFPRSGGCPAEVRGRSRSPGRGARIEGVRVVERIEVERIKPLRRVVGPSRSWLRPPRSSSVCITTLARTSNKRTTCSERHAQRPKSVDVLPMEERV